MEPTAELRDHVLYDNPTESEIKKIIVYQEGSKS